MKHFVCIWFLAVAYGNVIGIDFGSEFYKISLIGPGKKLVIVENDHTKRKTPTTVFFSQNERQFGFDAVNSGVKAPKSAPNFVNRHLGIPFNSTEHIQRYKDEYFPYEIEEDLERNTINIKVGDQLFQSEEITAMILENAKEMAERFAEGHAKDCVITVPSFYNRAQRISLLVAAQAAGLKVLSLMNENVGAAIYYGVDRFDNTTTHLAVFYNLGASSLQVSLAKYDVIMSSAGKLVENIEVLAHAADEWLGGRTIDATLAKYVIDEYKKKSGLDLNESPRAIAKLMSSINKLKQTLSANRVANLNIESIYQGNDLNMVIEREVFEQQWEHLHDRLLAPIREVLAQYGVDKSEIHSLEIIGGLIRIPKIQELLKEFMEVDELGWHLNGDEAMANGAVFFAANYSATVQVRPVLLSEYSTTPVVVKFEGPDKETTLFPRGTRLGTKKRISLTYGDDFTATLYTNISGELEPIQRYNITKVKEVSDKYDVEPLNYMIFLMDLSGITGLVEAESRFNATVEEIVKKKKPDLLDETAEEEGTGEGDEEGEGEGTGEGEDKLTEEDISDGIPEEDVERVEEDQPSEEAEQQESEEDSEQDPDGEEAESDEDAEDILAEDEEEKEPEKPKLKDDEEIVLKNKTLSVQLKLDSEELQFPRTINKTEMAVILDHLRELSKEDENRRKTAEARNNLESYIYFVKNKLDEDSFLLVTTEEDQELIRGNATEIQDWFEYESDGVDRSELREKQKILKDLVKGALERELEMEILEPAWDKAFAALEDLHDKWYELNSTKAFVPQKERDEVWNYINTTFFWLTDRVTEQEALALTDDPILTAKKIESKIARAEKKIDRLERKKEEEKKEKKKKDKKKDSDLPPDFINFGDGTDWSNIKFDNVKFGDKTYSNVDKDGKDGDGEDTGEKQQDREEEEGSFEDEKDTEDEDKEDPQDL